MRTSEELIAEAEEDLTPERLAKRTRAVQEKVELWWERFQKDVFPLLVPRRKWMDARRNLQVGDIVLLSYAAKFSRDKFRLARVMRLLPDSCGNMRTVVIGLRNRARGSREASEACLAGLTEMTVAVQRLVLILPRDEQTPDNVMEQAQTPTEPELEIPQEPLPQRVTRSRARANRMPLRIATPEDTPKISDL